MNSRFRQWAWIAGRFVRFLVRSGNRYRIHSPFLYDIIGKVVRKDRPARGGATIEEVRKACLNSTETIIKTDYGEGSGKAGTMTYPVKLRHIARSSLTSPRHARRLQRLAEHIRAERILELGTSLGMTTAYFAFAGPQCRVVTLEGCPELCRIARENFSRLGLENIELIEGRFEETLAEALKSLGTADLIYIDGNHRKEAILDYFFTCLRYMNNSSVIVIDDIHSSPGTEEAWEEICGHDRARVTLDLFFSGWVFLRQESSREHFRLRYI